ncbi:MAG TPA: phosphotransferase, partial [Roseiflexaceae bacterium]|nr:phosphotransferase [Roseiflexaceae bacterium]
MNMHAGEVAIDAALVARLVAAQLPHLATQPIQAVHSIGTVNAIYRLGDELCVRLPRLAAWAADLEREQAWLPYLAPHLSLRIPTPLARGEPSDEYPFPWAIYRWIDGRPYHDDLIADERRAAVDLAQFVIELRRIDPRGAPAGGRRPLNELDAQTRTALADSQSLIDTPAALAVWRDLLATPASHGT